MLSKYLGHSSRVLKPFCLRGGRYIIEHVTVTLYINTVQRMFPKWVYIFVVSDLITLAFISDL